MASTEWSYTAFGDGTNFLARGTGLAFVTRYGDDKWPRFGLGGQFQGWYHGVHSAGGAPGPNGQLGPAVNGYTLYCSVLGTGYWVPGVAGTSTYSPGVYGQTEDPSILPGDLIAGVVGTGVNRPGVIGWSSAGIGVEGATYSGTAVRADSFYGQAVYGLSQVQSGVTGNSGAYYTPLPNQPMIAGVVGSSAERHGVIGTSTSGAGLVGYSRTQMGVYGETGATGPNSSAGYFLGNVFVIGKLNVVGPQAAAVPFPDGSQRALYSMESPELWFEDFGTARLKRGRAVVKLDADFAKVIKRGDYRVFPAPEGDCRGLFVHRKSATTFEVRELMGGKSSIAFSYRIVGRRKDIKEHRRFAKIDTSQPVPARARHKPPSRAGFRAFVRRFEKEARQRAPKGAKKMRKRPSTIPSRDALMRLMQQTPERSEARGRSK
jgi:hypothetical protein